MKPFIRHKEFGRWSRSYLSITDMCRSFFHCILCLKKRKEKSLTRTVTRRHHEGSSKGDKGEND